VEQEWHIEKFARLAVTIVELLFAVLIALPRTRVVASAAMAAGIFGALCVSLPVLAVAPSDAQCNCLGFQRLPIGVSVALQGMLLILSLWLSRVWTERQLLTARPTGVSD